MENEAPCESVGWDEPGEVILVHKPSAFLESVLPKYFNRESCRAVRSCPASCGRLQPKPLPVRSLSQRLPPRPAEIPPLMFCPSHNASRSVRPSPSPPPSSSLTWHPPIWHRLQVQLVPAPAQPVRLQYAHIWDQRKVVEAPQLPSRAGRPTPKHQACCHQGDRRAHAPLEHHQVIVGQVGEQLGDSAARVPTHEAPTSLP